MNHSSATKTQVDKFQLNFNDLIVRNLPINYWNLIKDLIFTSEVHRVSLWSFSNNAIIWKQK